MPDLTTNANGTLATGQNGEYIEPAVAASTYGTPAWKALAYGGAGQDIYFAGTGGNRLIDWVGNHNSYYVPFSQFGMPTISRTLMPFLPEFLYALSASDGADQTLGMRTDFYCKTANTTGDPNVNIACSDFRATAAATPRQRRHDQPQRRAVWRAWPIGGQVFIPSGKPDD